MAEGALHFPEGFLWGTATSAHQVEGGNTNNDWWRWEQDGRHIRNGDRSGAACDWWNRAENDFDRALELGQNTHRLSVEWSRLEPRAGEWNQAAMDRYRRMLQALRDREMEPMVTLFHFTLPIWVADRGGWANPETIFLFTRFATRVVNELGDLVKLWCTINESVVYASMSHLLGLWPPGEEHFGQTVRVLRHLLLAHGEVYRTIHAIRGDAQAGLAKNFLFIEPLRPESWLDRRWAGQVDRLYNELVLQSITEGEFHPPLGWGRVPKLIDSCDFIGVNYYSRYLFGFDGKDIHRSFTPRLNPNGEISDFDYGEVYPEGLYHVLKRVAQYGKPIYITENGLPDAKDRLRPRFILTHLAQAWRAIQEGIQVRGYYHWSLVDNFEWIGGYAMRFGLIEVDFATQERRVRPSGRLYAEICRANAITPELVARYAPEAAQAVFGVQYEEGVRE